MISTQVHLSYALSLAARPAFQNFLNHNEIRWVETWIYLKLWVIKPHVTFSCPLWPIAAVYWRRLAYHRASARYGQQCAKRAKRNHRIFEQNQKGYNKRSSQAVSNPSTNRSRRCLTCQIRRDGVLSTWYGRNRKHCFHFMWKYDHWKIVCEIEIWIFIDIFNIYSK